jgi:hypothetical protein
MDRDESIPMSSSTGSFPVHMTDWQDTDVAMYSLGQALGCFAPDEAFGHVKGVFWGDNPLGRVLYDTLRVLVAGGVLEVDPDDDERYRWRADQPSRRVG